MSNKSLLVFRHVAVCPCTTSKAFKFFGLGFGLSEGGSLPSGVGGVSSKAAASIFVPSIAVPSRPSRSFWISRINRPSAPLPPSLSRPYLTNDDDEAHALHHGYAFSESTIASLRPKCLPSVLHKTTTSYIESLIHPHVVWSISTHTTEATAVVARCGRKARGRHIISAEGGTCIRSRRARVGAEPRLTEGRATATAAATTTEGARRTGTSEACYTTTSPPKRLR